MKILRAYSGTCWRCGSDFTVHSADGRHKSVVRSCPDPCYQSFFLWRDREKDKPLVTSPDANTPLHTEGGDLPHTD